MSSLLGPMFLVLGKSKYSLKESHLFVRICNGCFRSTCFDSNEQILEDLHRRAALEGYTYLIFLISWSFTIVPLNLACPDSRQGGQQQQLSPGMYSRTIS